MFVFKQRTAYEMRMSDWISDVCSSDLADRAAGGVMEIMVSDTGVGIPAEAMARIGEPFYQAHDRRRPVSAGTGLGLTLAHQLMKLHGGSFTIDSREGAGTAATLRFPAAAVTGLTDRRRLGPRRPQIAEGEHSRAWCREKQSQYGKNSVAVGSLKK